MIRTAARNTILLAALALASGSAAVSCSGKKGTATNVDRSDVGSVALAIRLASGAEVRTVSYEISGNGITPRTGTIDVSGSAVPSILVTGLPPGSGYTVRLTATSVDGGTMCSGSATFSVTAGATTSVTVGLTCRATATTGSVAVNTSINNCPVITSATVSPLTAAVGGSIAVSASASDPDSGATLTYAWSAPSGSFAAASSASTSYTCTPAGPRTLTLRVSDGSCEETLAVDVNCTGDTGPLCGNGVVEAGETCEPPGTATCSATCQTISGTGGTGGGGSGGATGGSGGATGGTGGATGGTGGATGGTGGATGGSGGATGGTGGDTGGTGGATGGTGGATGGTGGVGGATGGSGGTGGSTGGTGGGNAACDACMATNCPADVAGCGSFTGQDRADCDALMACTVRTSCVAPPADGMPCYCGTAEIGACLGGSANGMCKTEVEVAGKTTSAQVLGERFVDPTYPLGGVINFYGCRATFCEAECRAP